jgi:hypothetical protein
MNFPIDQINDIYLKYSSSEDVNRAPIIIVAKNDSWDCLQQNMASYL